MMTQRRPKQIRKHQITTIADDDYFDGLDDISLDCNEFASSEPEADIDLSSIVDERKILYGDKFMYSNNWTPYEISFKDVDKYDFSKKAFNEFIIKQDYVHLYFDFDSIKTEEEYKDVILWLDSLTSVFGDYSIGGYCNNKKMENYGYRLIEDNDHFLSIHVVFYTTMIKTEDLVKIMKHTDKKGFAMEGVHPLCDPNVYKLVPRGDKKGSRQVFRHVLSDKIYKENDSKNKNNHGFILNGKKPSTQIVQVRGHEKEITKEMWSVLFKEKETKMEERKRIQIEKKEKNFDIDSIEFEDELIIFDRDEMLEFLSYFDSEFDNLMKTLAPLRYSPYDKEFLRDVLIEWYGRREHTNGVEIVVDQILGSYQKKEDNNKWFFSIIKHLPQDVKEQYLNRYTRSIDFTININNSSWTFENIKKKSYEKHEFVKLINDLRGVIGFSGNRWCVKQKEDNQIYIKETSTNKIREEFIFYKPFRSNTKINMYTGFKFKEIYTNDFTILDPFLYHIKHIICNDNEDKYTYFMNWWANIFQNITVKNGTMPIIFGAQGSGKSFAVEVFCELLGKYALSNCDDMDKVFGKFNGLIGRNLVICLNEPPEATDKFKYSGKIKSKLTQKKTVQELKGVDQIEIESWANYIMTTNNPNPIQEEKGDRRIIYFETNNEMCGNDEYFNKLCKNIQEKKQGEYNDKFMGVLLHYMKTQIDVSDWNSERLIRQINNNTNTYYNENLERQYLDLNGVDKYVVDHYKKFIYGIALDDIYVEGYKSTGLARKLSSVCDVQRITLKQYKKIIEEHRDIYGSWFHTSSSQKQLRIYKLKQREQIPDLYTIIDYKTYNEQDDNNEDEEEDEL